VGIVQSVNEMRNNVVLGGDENLWWGRADMRETMGPFTFPAGMSTFLQVNPYQTSRLYDLAVASLPDGASVLDLYSGIGSISLWASRKARSVLGIEENPAAVDAARRAAEGNSVGNARFLASDVGAALADPGRLLSEAGLPANAIAEAEAIIVDPPRKGLEPSVREALISMKASRLVYVSCYPTTLARDARALAGTWKLSSISPADLFPHTRHVECVAVFARA
jgi:23S rRNA (uracil1939-C5)-methyltransferase